MFVVPKLLLTFSLFKDKTCTTFKVKDQRHLWTGEYCLDDESYMIAGSKIA